MFKWLGTIKSYFGWVVGGIIATLIALLGIQTKRVKAEKAKLEKVKAITEQIKQKAEIAKVGQEVATQSIENIEQLNTKKAVQETLIKESKDDEEVIQNINSIIDKFNNNRLLYDTHRRTYNYSLHRDCTNPHQTNPSNHTSRTIRSTQGSWT